MDLLVQKSVRTIGNKKIFQRSHFSFRTTVIPRKVGFHNIFFKTWVFDIKRLEIITPDMKLLSKNTFRTEYFFWSHLSWLKVRFQHWLASLTSLETACRAIHQSRPKTGPVWYPQACEYLYRQLLSMDGPPKKGN